MNTPLHPLYTNDVSPEFLDSLNDSPFTEEQVAKFDEKAQALIRQQQDYVIAHPPIAVYRWATEGSQTRNGGWSNKRQRRWSSRWITVSKCA
ncbi:hypothetical protein [Pseudomonas sp. MPC6]|uniref:hypothetical protein n=1 Tax=unclassified Pseudomonas TaxID=196821 RepID=UPI001E2EBA41|nr:hypothetical protein [Pseudomonas sp. MPC6]